MLLQGVVPCVGKTFSEWDHRHQVQRSSNSWQFQSSQRSAVMFWGWKNSSASWQVLMLPHMLPDFPRLAWQGNEIGTVPLEHVLLRPVVGCGVMRIPTQEGCPPASPQRLSPSLCHGSEVALLGSASPRCTSSARTCPGDAFFWQMQQVYTKPCCKLSANCISTTKSFAEALYSITQKKVSLFLSIYSTQSGCDQFTLKWVILKIR